MDQQQVEPIGAKAQHRLLHRTHGAVIGIVDHCPVWLTTGKARAIASPVKRIHPAADLGADHNLVARQPPDRCATAMLGQAMSIKRRGVDQIDAKDERALHRGDGPAVIQMPIEITERRGSEAERRNLNRGPPQQTSR